MLCLVWGDGDLGGRFYESGLYDLLVFSSILICIYLFSFGCAESLLLCRLSSLGELGLLFIADHGPRVCAEASVVAAHGAQ